MADGELRYEYGDGDQRRKRVRKVTEGSLRTAAQRYIERYGGPRAAVQRTLERKVYRARVLPGVQADQCAAWIKQVLDELEGSAALNDRYWATERARTLHERGTPLRAIRERLRVKGLASADIDAALDSLRGESEDPDMQAALAYAQRRRFGPFRLHDRAERREKDLAAMARAGFFYGVAAKVIDAKL